MADLTNIKIILGLNDNSKDEVLSSLYNNVKGAILLYIGQKILPAELKFIADEATISRYNRLGSEGLVRENIDVIGMEYLEDVLGAYKLYLDAYINKNSQTSPKKIRMI